MSQARRGLGEHQDRAFWDQRKGSQREAIPGIRTSDQVFPIGEKNNPGFMTIAPYQDWSVNAFVLVGGVVTRVDGPVIHGRRMLYVSNATAGVVIWVGPASSLAANNGFPLLAGQGHPFPIGEASQMFAFAAAPATIGVIQYS